MEYIDTTKLNDKEFVEVFEQRVRDTISDSKLFDNQKLLVAASGGKDSTVLLYLMKKFGYDIEALTINAHIGCYSDESLENLKKFCSKENIKLHEVSLQEEFGYKLCHIMAIMEERGFNKTSCSICGTLRRYLLNKYAKELDAKILLTGHNLDDESDAILMTIFRGDLKQIARIGPLAMNRSFVKKVKPLYFIFEDEVERYSKVKNFDVHYGRCPCSVKGSRRFYYELGLNPEKKFNLTKNIINSIPKLKSYFKGTSDLKQCGLCEQPSSNEICQTCMILSALKDPSIKKLKVNDAIARFEAMHNSCDTSLVTIK